MHATLFGLKRAYYAGLRVQRGILQGQKLTPARFDLLFAISQVPHKWLLQSEAYKTLGVAGPTVRRMVKSLVQLGYVIRVKAPHDGRERIVQLTEQGRAVMDSAVRGAIRTRIVELGVVRAVGGPLRSFAEGCARVEKLDELLYFIRYGWKDRARMLYAFDPYAWGWAPKKAALLYEPERWPAAQVSRRVRAKKERSRAGTSAE